MAAYSDPQPFIDNREYNRSILMTGEDLDWSDIDSQDTPEEFKEYLDIATGADLFQMYKQRSHRKLHPSEGDRILDAGCGVGDDVLTIAERVTPDGEVIGIDKSEEMIETAQEKAANRSSITFHVREIYETGFESNAFDASRADRVFQHLDDPAAAIDELKRVTRAGGKIGLSDPDWETLVIDAPGDDPPNELLDPEFSMATNPTIGRELYRLARNAGLEDVDIDPDLFVTTDFEFAAQMVQFEDWTDTLVQAREVTQNDVEQWFDRLRRADKAGEFLLSFGLYTVTGTVPRDS